MSRDEALLRQIRASAAVADPVPDTVVHLARSAFVWASDGAPVAAITYDSVCDETTTRSADTARVVELYCPAMRVALEVTAVRGARSVTGQLDPPQHAQVALRHAGTSGTTPVETDDLGRFVVDDLGAGPFSLRVATDTGAMTTEWILL